MSRRGPGEGTCRKRKRKDGTTFWECRLTLPGGKRPSFYGDTLAEARRKVDEAKRLIAQNLPLPDDRQTVKQYLESWLEMKQRKLKPTTWQRYKELVTLHILPTLGYVPLARLGRHQIGNLYAQKLNEVQSNGKKLSPTTVHHLHTVLHAALADALEDGLVAFNETNRVKDKPGMPHHEMTILSFDDQRRLLSAAEGDRFEALYVLALGTGMREGELLALKWSDIDWHEGVVHVGATLHYLHGQFVFAPPKTRRSKRSIKLWPEELEALKRHLTRQKEERLRQGPAWDESYNLVFCNGIGRPIEATNFIKRSFRHLLEKAGLVDESGRPKIRFHDLRHTSVTVMRRRGLPIDLISMILGHANAAFTIDRYGHLTVEMQDAYIGKNRLQMAD